VATGETPVSQDGEVVDPMRQLIHDFRNLLAVIVNYSELIGEELNDPEAIRADIQEIKSAAEKAIAMTEKLPRPGRPVQP
jgi:signal transduction histidine kinase